MSLSPSGWTCFQTEKDAGNDRVVAAGLTGCQDGLLETVASDPSPRFWAVPPAQDSSAEACGGRGAWGWALQSGSAGHSETLGPSAYAQGTAHWGEGLDREGIDVGHCRGRVGPRKGLAWAVVMGEQWTWGLPSRESGESLECLSGPHRGPRD